MRSGAARHRQRPAELAIKRLAMLGVVVRREISCSDGVGVARVHRVKGFPGVSPGAVAASAAPRQAGHQVAGHAGRRGAQALYAVHALVRGVSLYCPWCLQLLTLAIKRVL